VFGQYPQFLSDCDHGLLPDYSFIEPNYSDHDGDDGEAVASDQHPDHDVQAGEALIAEVYTHIKNGPNWANTALLVVYDEHGAIFDHVPPPACPADTFHSTQVDPGRVTVSVRPAGRAGTGDIDFAVDSEGTVVNRVFDHASIPATITKFFLGSYPHVSLREANAAVLSNRITGRGTWRTICSRWMRCARTARTSR